MNRKHLISVMAGIGLATAPTAAFAGEGDATALHVEGVITISDCHAEDGQSNCTALSLLGQEIAGSNQEGPGSSGNTGYGGEDPSGNDGGSIYLFGSESNVNDDGSSNSRSSAASINIAGQVQVEVLRAQANSNGDAESDGVYINLAGQEFHILHAQSVGGEGSAAVAIIGGQEILGSGADGGLICPLDLNPLPAETNVVCASGRQAGVLDNTDIGGGVVTGEVVTANSRDGGDDTVTPSPEPEPAPQPEPPVGETPETPLARTGLDLLALLMAGAASIASGEAMRRRAAGSFVTIA